MTFRDKDYAADLGEYLREKRQDANLTQAEVAKVFGHSSSQFISNIERGTCAVPLHILVKVVELYKVPDREFVEFMMGLEKRFWHSNFASKRRRARA